MMLKIAILEECFLHFPYLRNKLDKVASKTIVLFSHSNLPQNTYGEIIVTEESIVEDTKTIYETFLDENDETRWSQATRSYDTLWLYVNFEV